MHKRLDRAHLAIPLVLGLVTLISVGVLLAWDVNPKFFPARAHDFLAAFPLAMIAIAYLLYQSARRPAAKEFAGNVPVAGAKFR
jgi:hypothetical protein